MQETMLLTIAAWLVATLFGMLTALVGWTGNKVVGKLDDVVKKLGEVSAELHERINGLDRRVTVLAAARERIHKIRDDEDRAIRGESPHGTGSHEASDILSEVGFLLMIAIDRLSKAKK